MQVQTIPQDYRQPFNPRLDPRWGVVAYDSDNAYPQRTRAILESSPTGVSCRNKMARFLSGKGFEDLKLNKAIVNRKGVTAVQLLRILSKDMANHGYYTLHVNYSLNYRISEINRINPEYCRLSYPDSNEYSPKIAVNKDWLRVRKDLEEIQRPDFINVFNSDPEAVKLQIEKCGGVARYKGQVLFHSGDMLQYTRVHYDALLNALEVDAEITNGDLRKLKRGFMAKQVFAFSDPISEVELPAIKNQLKKLQGANADDVMIIDGMGDAGLSIIPINHSYTDQEYINTEERNRMKIYRGFNQPAILHSDYRQGGMGGATEHEDAYKMYNQETIEYRRILSETFELLNMFMERPMSDSGNFQIQPLEFNSSAKALDKSRNNAGDVEGEDIEKGANEAA